LRNAGATWVDGQVVVDNALPPIVRFPGTALAGCLLLFEEGVMRLSNLARRCAC